MALEAKDGKGEARGPSSQTTPHVLKKRLPELEGTPIINTLFLFDSVQKGASRAEEGGDAVHAPTLRERG